MRHVIMLVLLSGACASLCAQSYTVSSGPNSAFSIVGAGWTTPNFKLGDDELSPLVTPGGWSFPYFGQIVDSFRISSNGYIVLGQSLSHTPPRTPDHQSTGGNIVAPCWTDLNGQGALGAWAMDGPYYYMVVNGVLIIEFWNVPHKSGGSVMCQVALDPFNGDIIFAYGNVPGVSGLGPRTVSISSPFGTAQEILCGYDSGYVAADGSISAWPAGREIRFKPRPLAITMPLTLPSGVEGQAYSQQFDASGGVPPYTWSAGGLPAGFSMSAAGLLTAPPQSVTPQTVSFTVTVRDSALPQAADSASFVLTIVPALNIMTPQNLPQGFAQADYTATLACAGGVPPYMWLGTGLPAGWNLGTNGVLFAPAGSVVAGNFSFVATVTDSGASQASRTFLVDIVTPPALAILTTTLPQARVGESYAASVVSANGQGALNWSLVSGSLPPGLNCALGAGSTTQIVGTPQDDGPFTFRLEVRDSLGRTATQTFVLDVVHVPLRGNGGGGACTADPVFNPALVMAALVGIVMLLKRLNVRRAQAP